MRRASAAFLLALATTASAQPAAPLRVIVVYPPGGPSDVVARVLAERLGARLGDAVIVENRSGASGAIGIDAMAKAAPDGRTLAFSAVSPVTLLPHVARVPYDPIKDVAPVASVMFSPVYLVATPAFTGRTLEDAIAQARTKPGSIRLATSGVATLGHVMLEQIRSAASVDIVHVPYKGGGQVALDAAAGQFELFTTNPAPGVNGLVAQGKLRMLAVAAPQRLAAHPSVPTMAERGRPESNYASLFGLFAPGRTPEAEIARLNAEVNAVLALPAVRERIAGLDNVPAPDTPQAFARRVLQEYASNARLVARTGLRAD